MSVVIIKLHKKYQFVIFKIFQHQEAGKRDSN